MSGKHALEANTPNAEQPQRVLDVAPRGFQLHAGDPIPIVLTVRQLASLLQISERALLDLRKAGTHRGVKQLDAPGDPRFCGRTFKAWLDGDIDQPASRHFFGGTRRRG